MYVTVGIPGCGKTTYCKYASKNHGGVHISRDEIRFALLNETDSYFARETEVWNNFISTIQKALDNPGIRTIYVDATHITQSSRDKLLNALTISDDVDIYWLAFVTGLETALERNSNRAGRAFVPEKTIKNMYSSLTYPINNVIIIDSAGVDKSE